MTKQNKVIDSFTLDPETVELLRRIAESRYEGNKSQTVRMAIRLLAGTLPRKDMPKKQAHS